MINVIITANSKPIVCFMIRILNSWNVCYQLNGLIKVCVWAQIETSETWPCKLFFQQNTKKTHTHTAKKDIASRKCLCTITYVHLMNDVVTQSDSNCYYFWTAYSTIVDIFFISLFFAISIKLVSSIEKRRRFGWKKNQWWKIELIQTKYWISIWIEFSLFSTWCSLN